MKEMVGGCCVCSDDRGWPENPLVYCDGVGCTVAVHQACYGIVDVPLGNWYCRKCEDTNSTKVRCELCPNKEGALKPTDNKAWAHVVCALYIPEVRFGNVTTMEPIILTHIPQERFHKTCYICEERNRSRANFGACMQCNKTGCRQQFHVTCAQGLGLLCEEASNYMENVKYCGYCHHHYTKLKGGNVKVIPPYRPIGANDSPEESPSKEAEPNKPTSKRKLSTSSSKGAKSSSTPAELERGAEDEKITNTEGEPNKLGNKRRKGGSRTPPADGTSPEGSSRPSSPGGSSSRQGSTPLPPPAATPPIVSSHLPLEALPPSVPNLNIQPSPPQGATGGQLSQGTTNSSSSDLPSHHPSKRGRSQSSDKSEKGRRWTKRSSGKANSPPPQSLQQQPGSKSNSPGESSITQQNLSEIRSSRGSRGAAGSSASLPASSSSSSTTSVVAVKEEKDVKIFQNGLHAPHMLGNQLNPSSTMAQKMCDTLSQEMVAHSVFSQQESSQSSNLVGPQLHRPSQNRGGPWSSGNTTTNTAPSHVPSSLEHLLERQWEQGSQFLMEQAQHFDIASLLSCLHQLRAENAQLEEHVTSLVQRRDHLLAVNARLAIPLITSQQHTQHQTQQPSQHTQQQQQQVNNVVASNPSPVVNNPPVVLENGMATPAEQSPYQRNTPQSLPRSSSAGFATGNSQQHSQQNSVVVRASSADRRSSSAGSTYSNHSNPLNNPLHNTSLNPHGNPSLFSTSQPQPQSQVVIRRDMISEIHLGTGGNLGGTANTTNSSGVSGNPSGKPSQP